MRTLLIYHAGSRIEEQVLSGWLDSFSDLAGTIAIHEPGGRRLRRIRREITRVGWLRFLDVLAFRVYYRFTQRSADDAWEKQAVQELEARYPMPRERPTTLSTESPNAPEALSFVRELRPDLVVARCRMLLDEALFSVPQMGTFVLHPGIAPEYRNSHGCFWALARRDLDHVGLTLLRIDAGVDTGPVYGYFTYEYDELTESHIVIQKRMLLENLDTIRDRLLEIGRGEAHPIDTSGRESRAWGQPWLSAYVGWKRQAKTSA